jgi:transcriptional regulator with XRE-family HTH domain
MRESLGTRIKFLRKERDLTQKQLAESLLITRSALSKWEVGRAMPDLPSLVKLADYFHVSVDYLLCRNNNRKMYSNVNIPDFFEEISNEDQKFILKFIEFMKCNSKTSKE